MIDLIIRNAGQILTCTVPDEDPPYAGALQGELGITEGGVEIHKGRIVAVGPEAGQGRAHRIINAQGGVVLPGFVDCHTHAVFAGNRAEELEERARGVSYEEITRRGGGILSSVRALRAASDKELGQAVMRHLDAFLDMGTTTIEAKSGYGLSIEDEIRSLKALGRRHPVEVVRTCLAGHTVPEEFADQREAYINLVCKRILPTVAEEGLADYCDVFCEKGVFSFEEAQQMLEAGKAVGLRPRIHADQLRRTGGCRIACRVGAITADHIEYASRGDAVAMKEAGVIGVLLPAANHVLDQAQRPATRMMIPCGLPLALGTDFNPGTAPTQSMPLTIHLAVVRFQMSVAEAIVAATINAACAVERQGRIGSLEPEKQADVILCDIDDYHGLGYWFGRNPVHTVIKKGKVVVEG